MHIGVIQGKILLSNALNINQHYFPPKTILSARKGKHHCHLNAFCHNCFVNCSFQAENVFIEESGIPDESVDYLVGQKKILAGLWPPGRVCTPWNQLRRIWKWFMSTCSPPYLASIKHLKLKRRLLWWINNYPKHTSKWMMLQNEGFAIKVSWPKHHWYFCINLKRARLSKNLIKVEDFNVK